MNNEWSAGESSDRAKGGQAHGSGISIKPENKGKLHTKLGVSQGNKIPASDLAIKPSDSSSTVKEKTFANNAKKWNH